MNSKQRKARKTKSVVLVVMDAVLLLVDGWALYKLLTED